MKLTSGHNEIPQRLVFCDNVRSLVVVLVVVVHAGLAYSGLGFEGMWPARGPDGGPAMAALTLVLDSFLMPLLFMLAGYFALPSLRPKGAGRFLAGKVRQLVVPAVLVVLFLNPLIVYVWGRTHFPDSAEYPRSLAGWWVFQLRRIGSFHLDELGSPASYFFAHVWFVSVLMLFFVVLAAGYAAKRAVRPTVDATAPKPASMGTVIGALLLTGVLTGVIASAVRILLPEVGFCWVVVLGLIEFRSPDVVFHVAYFLLGLMAYRGRWFARPRPFGPVWPWLTSCLLVTAAYLWVTQRMLELYPPPAPRPAPFLAAFWILRGLVCATFVGWLIALAEKYWNGPKREVEMLAQSGATGVWSVHGQDARGTQQPCKPYADPLSRIGRRLAATSYHVYLVHLPLVVSLQFLLADAVGAPAIVQFGLVTVLSVAASFAVCELLVRRYPRSSMIGLAGLFAVLCWILW